jgi:hypothetical protein
MTAVPPQRLVDLDGSLIEPLRYGALGVILGEARGDERLDMRSCSGPFRTMRRPFAGAGITLLEQFKPLDRAREKLA